LLGIHLRRKPADVSAAIKALLAAANVKVNRLAVEAGLALLDAGGDFADGVIAYPCAPTVGDALGLLQPARRGPGSGLGITQFSFVHDGNS
jgi:gamma-glutamyltranspeptidase